MDSNTPMTSPLGVLVGIANKWLVLTTCVKASDGRRLTMCLAA